MTVLFSAHSHVYYLKGMMVIGSGCLFLMFTGSVQQTEINIKKVFPQWIISHKFLTRAAISLTIR